MFYKYIDYYHNDKMLSHPYTLKYSLYIETGARFAEMITTAKGIYAISQLLSGCPAKQVINIPRESDC